MRKLIILLSFLLCFSCSIEEIDKNPDLITNGIDGQDGSDGQDGINGIDGINGTDGADGEDGLSTWYYINENGCVVFFQYHETNGEAGWQEDEERESEESEPICIENGTDGQDGTNGEDGENGHSTYINVEIIESGDICEHGGKRIIVWTDYNRDDIRQDDEITQDIIWCVEKCPHVCTDVYDTVNCNNGKVYVMWIDGVYYYNIDLKFEQLENGTATLYGKVNKHNSTKVFLVDVIYSNVLNETIKDHNCLTIDSSEWIQYTDMNGTVRSVDGSINFTVSRRGEPFQVGVGANVTSSENTFGASGWFITSGHASCQGDFNLNICK